MNLSATTDSALTPIHRIGAVANLCGVPVATLRVWERRYGVVAPLKTPGGQRLYTDHDVLQAAGLAALSESGTHKI